MKTIDLSKVFWSKCRAKLLEKFFLEYESGNNEWLHMRAIARDLDEQINSVKRELDNLYEIWFLRYKMDMKKKIFFVNEGFILIDEFKDIFLKSYDPLDKIKKFFKSINTLELILVNEDIRYKLIEPGKCILDIFLIGEIDKDGFNDFLAHIFYNRKIKYAIISTEDFYNRIKYGDKLISNILNQKGNIFLKDTLKVMDKIH